MRKLILCLVVASALPLYSSAESKYYDVSVRDGAEWIEAFTDDALCSDGSLNSEIWNDWDNSKKLRDTMSYALFEAEFDGPVRIRVRRKDEFGKVEIRPTTSGIKADVIDDRTIEFTIPSYDFRKLSVEFDGDRQHNLFVIGVRPDGPQKDTATYYFGPGEHEVGNIELRDGESVYIDYGAKVYGAISINGDNCTVAGHGVLSGQHFRHYGDIYSCGEMMLIANEERRRELRNITVRDITIIDSPSWTLTVFNSENVRIDGVNMIAWTLNGDGIDIVSCRNVCISNCFLRNYDDCITLKVRHTAYPMSDLYNVEVKDCLIFNDYARGIVVGIENGNTKVRGCGYIHNIDIHDCIILENSTSLDIRDLRAGIAIGQAASPENIYVGGSARKMNNIHIHGILFDHLDPTGRCLSIMQYADMNSPCLMSDVCLEDFSILGYDGMESPAALIITNQHKIKGMTVSNFTIDGKKITSPGTDFVIVGNAEVSFLK